MRYEYLVYRYVLSEITDYIRIVRLPFHAHREKTFLRHVLVHGD